MSIEISIYFWKINIFLKDHISRCSAVKRVAFISNLITQFFAGSFVTQTKRNKMNFRCVAAAGLLLLFNTTQTYGQLEEYFKWKQISFVRNDNRLGKKIPKYNWNDRELKFELFYITQNIIVNLFTVFFSLVFKCWVLFNSILINSLCGNVSWHLLSGCDRWLLCGNL